MRKRCATPHVLLAPRDPLSERQPGAVGRTLHGEAPWIERPPQVSRDVFSHSAGQDGRNGVSDLPVLLETRLVVGPMEIVGEGLQPRALADREDAIVLIVNWTEW